MKTILVVGLITACFSGGASAAWKVERGHKVMSLRDDPVGLIATLSAMKVDNASPARLQIECFVSPQLRGVSLGIVLSKPTAPGALGWRFSFDSGREVKEGPYSRMSLTVISLSDASGAIYKGLPTAKQLNLILIPASGPALAYEFDVSGASDAIKKLGCK